MSGVPPPGASVGDDNGKLAGSGESPVSSCILVPPNGGRQPGLVPAGALHRSQWSIFRLAGAVRMRKLAVHGLSRRGKAAVRTAWSACRAAAG
jgi:hypothetical protein